MNNYYRRSGTPVSRSNRVVENNKRNFKMKYKFMLSAALTFITCILSYVGFDYTVFLIPALTNIILLIGSMESTKQVVSYVLPFILVLPVYSGITNGVAPAHIALQIAVLIMAMVLCILYRPFLWKRSVLLGDLPLWYFILFGSVTNEVTGHVLLLSIAIKTLLAVLINLGIHFAVKALLTGEEIHKWTEQS